jgi:hypothetical protein
LLKDVFLDELTGVLDTDNLLSLLRKTRADKNRGQMASEIVAEYCNQNQIDVDTFTTMTCAGCLPYIRSSAVWRLLGKERELFGEQSMSNLQLRCIDALATGFGYFHCGEESPLRLQSKEFMHKLINKLHKRMTMTRAVLSDDEDVVGDDDDEDGSEGDDISEISGQDDDDMGGEGGEDEEEPGANGRNVRPRID